MHKEIIKTMGVSATQYLASMRRSQPIPELERKAKKARRRNLWTCEELDVGIAKGRELVLGIATLFEQGGQQ